MALICSLLLVWMPFGDQRAQAATSAQAAKSCCQPQCPMACCAAQPSAPAPADPLTPTSNVSRDQSLVPAVHVIAWKLPEFKAPESDAVSLPTLAPVGIPLFTLDCAWLI